MSDDAVRGPLPGLRVVEVGQMLAGPFCGHLFADYGAEVIKVEVPDQGDIMRHWGGLYNREMKHLMLNHAFRFVKTVVFLVGPKNLRSQRALAKIGALPAEPITHPTRGENLVFKIERPELPNAESPG